MKKSNNLSALGAKIAHKSFQTNIDDRFNKADAILGVKAELKREKIVRKSVALLEQDIQRIENIKQKCLNHRIKPSESQAVRLALMAVADLDDMALIGLLKKLPIIPTGRPKK